MFENVKVGNKIEISYKQDFLQQKTFLSQVEKVLENKQVIAQVPMLYGKVSKLPTTEEYTMLFISDTGVYVFEAEIVNYFYLSGYEMMLIKLISEGQKKQRRDFFRFSCLLPMKFSVIDVPEMDPTVKHDGFIKDIGGGGMKYVSNADIPESCTIKVLVILSNNYVILSGKLLQKQVLPSGSQRFQYRLSFASIASEDREKIIHFIYNEQRRVLLREKN